MTITAISPNLVSIDQCWCGQSTFVPCPHGDYLLCATCGTAKLRSGLATGQDAVSDERDHLYGEHYWHEQMPRHGCPSITVRARTDLVERAQFWLRELFKYRLPPGRVFEVGCAHGGFLKLLQSAGFETAGMEMSPSIIETARRWFDVEVLKGPIEYMTATLGKFDVVVMLDVIEHLADPVGSTSRIVAHLEDDGLLMVQTPCYENVTSATWRMFNTPEHTFLFSRESIRQLFTRIGFAYTAFTNAIFPDDMFVFASRRPLTVNPPELIAARLAATPDGRLVLAMQDMYRMLHERHDQDPSNYHGTRVLGRAFLRALLRSLIRRLKRQ